MANKKMTEFTTATDPSELSFLVGYSVAANDERKFSQAFMTSFMNNNLTFVKPSQVSAAGYSGSWNDLFDKPSTSGIPEGSNLYATQPRDYTWAKALLKPGANVTITPNDGLMTLTVNVTAPGTGTVTSVGISTSSTGLTVGPGSPITSSGTLTVNLNSTLQAWALINPNTKWDTSAATSAGLIGVQTLTDANTYVSTGGGAGFFRGAGAATNLPAGGAAAFMQLTYTTQDFMQFAYSLNNDRIFGRRMRTNVWQPYVEFWTSANLLNIGATASTARTALGLGTAALANTGSSGASVPLLNVANTWSSPQTITSASSAVLNLTCSGTGGRTVQVASTTSGNAGFYDVTNGAWLARIAADNSLNLAGAINGTAVALSGNLSAQAGSFAGTLTVGNGLSLTSSNSTSGLNFTDVGGSGPNIRMAGAAGNKYIRVNSATNALEVVNSAYNSVLMGLDNSGNLSTLGVHLSGGGGADGRFGRASDTTYFLINGSDAGIWDSSIGWQVRSNRSSGDLAVRGWVYAPNFSISSDRRIKDHIDYVSGSDALSMMMLLKPAFYTKNGRNEWGMYAQDLERVFPEMVTETEMYGMKDCKAVSMEMLHAPHIAATQELYRQVQELRAEVQRLRQSN